MRNHFVLPSKEIAESLLRDLGWYTINEVSGEEEFNYYDDQIVVCKVIGFMYHGGEYDNQGVELIAPILSTGYHLDVNCLDIPQSLAQFQVQPKFIKHYLGGKP